VAKIVKPPKPKQATCNACFAVVEYLPEEVKSWSGTCMGDSTGYEYVTCPREKCPGRCVIRGTEY
jgi:hypothetical protein